MKSLKQLNKDGGSNTTTRGLMDTPNMAASSICEKYNRLYSRNMKSKKGEELFPN